MARRDPGLEIRCSHEATIGGSGASVHSHFVHVSSTPLPRPTGVLLLSASTALLSVSATAVRRTRKAAPPNRWHRL
ncbi:hypothetical protein ACFPM0_00480 [Pseudonocardia sulfidoxydans]|uniref:hypothetical protein n=1 Tax=Pseudonocardia sulfidoxydans TaxID=54011 RepID=UPI0036157F1B